jgi:uncharacterized cupredoxin-like copper-binding protein
MVRKVLVALGLTLALSAGTAAANEGLEPVATGELNTNAEAPATVEEAAATVEEAAATVEEAPATVEEAATVEAEVTCAELSVEAEATASADSLESSLDDENIAWD